MPENEEAAGANGGALVIDSLGRLVDPRVSTPSHLPQAETSASPPLVFVGLRTESGAIYGLERLASSLATGGAR